MNFMIVKCPIVGENVITNVDEKNVLSTSDN